MSSGGSLLLGGGLPFQVMSLLPFQPCNRRFSAWWSYRSVAFPPTSVIFPSPSAADRRQSDVNKSAVHKRHSISVCITCTSQIVRRLSLMYAVQGGHYGCDDLDPAHFILGLDYLLWSRHVPIFFDELRFHRCSFLDNTCISALSPWIRFTQRRRQ